MRVVPKLDLLHITQRNWIMSLTLTTREVYTLHDKRILIALLIFQVIVLVITNGNKCALYRC